jgi:hypothetical protein
MWEPQPLTTLRASTACFWRGGTTDVYRQSVGLLGRVIALSQGHCLHRTTQRQKKRGQTSMPQVGFEPTISVFEWAKDVYVLGPARPL